MSKDRRAALGIIIAIVVVPLVVVLSFVMSFYSQLGGVSHDPLDATVRSARMKADTIARVDVDKLVNHLSPALGTPAKRALIDTCWDTNNSESLNNDITCGRAIYLLYPMPRGETPVAWNLSKPLTSEWSPDQYRDCSSPAYVTRWCMTGTASRSTLQLQVNSAQAAADRRYPTVKGGDFPTEMDGYRELAFATSEAPCVVVMYQLSYFAG